ALRYAGHRHRDVVLQLQRHLLRRNRRRPEDHDHEREAERLQECAVTHRQIPPEGVYSSLAAESLGHLFARRTRRRFFMATDDQKPDTATRELNSQALALAEQLEKS